MCPTSVYGKEEEKEGNHILFQKYCLIEKLGSGGSSTVYLAHHMNLDMPVIIKRLHKTPQMIESFSNEVNILKNLKNPNIPLLYDVQEDDNYHYLIEEYLEGESLVSYVSNQIKLSQEVIIEYGIQLCEILQYLHDFPMGSIIHLDLQPKNIILSEGKLKLIDFGNAVCLEQNKKRNFFFGTLGYAAPEQYKGNLLDGRADIYGLGSILYYLVTKKEAVKSGNQILNLEEINYISPNLKKVIQKCLSYNPSQRYTTVLEVLKQLRALRRVKLPKHTQKKSSLSISIAGTQSRIGITHISLALANFLNESGYQSIYKEENHSRAISSLKEHCAQIKEKEGTYYYHSLKIRPNYEGIVTFQKEDYSFVINDFGVLTEDNIEEFEKSQIHFLVGGIKEWEIDYIKDARKLLYEMERVKDITYLINFTEERHFFRFMKKEVIKAYRVPYFPNPLELDKHTKAFFESVCREVFAEN